MPTYLIFFFIPVLNYLLMAILTVLPSSVKKTWGPQKIEENAKHIMSPLAIILFFAIFGTLFSWLSANIFKVYAESLFMGGPVSLGLAQGYIINKRRQETWKSTVGQVVLTIFLVHLFLLLFALEGVICLAMAFIVDLVRPSHNS